MFGSDRWWWSRGGAVAGSTLSQQVGSNSKYICRLQRDSGNTSTQQSAIFQDLETVNSLPLQGKIITLSLYARMGANYSAASSLFVLGIATGTGTDQTQYSGYTGMISNLVSKTLTSSFQLLTMTITVPSNATQIGIRMHYDPVGTAGANDYIEFSKVMLNEGPVAAPFQTAGAIEEELSMCQILSKTFPLTTAPAQDAGITGAVTIALLAQESL